MADKSFELLAKLKSDTGLFNKVKNAIGADTSSSEKVTDILLKENPELKRLVDNKSFKDLVSSLSTKVNTNATTVAKRALEDIKAGDRTYDSLNDVEKAYMKTAGLSGELSTFRKEAEKTEAITDTVGEIEGLGFDFKQKDFKYGGLDERSQKYLDLLEQSQQKQAQTSQRQLAETQSARGVARSGQALKQSANMNQDFLNQLEMQKHGYRQGEEASSFQRFLGDESKRYGQASDQYQRDLGALLNRQGVQGQERSQLWNEQMQAQQFRNQMYMQNLQNQFASAQSEKDRAYQQQMMNSQKPGAWDYALQGIGALGSIAGGASGLLGALGGGGSSAGGAMHGPQNNPYAGSQWNPYG